MKLSRRALLALATAASLIGAPSFAQDKGTVGIAMPTQSSARWISDGNSMVEQFTAAGYATEVVERVLRLVRISEWKRHQAAPGPKVSRRAFGRERRYPITNGYQG